MAPLGEGLPPSPGQPLFEFDLDILVQFGVRLPPEQAVLLEQHVHGPGGWAMVVTPLLDPRDRYRLVEPLATWDADEQRVRLMLYPRVVEIDWQHMYDPGVYQKTLACEAAWRRFPSLPGRARSVTCWDEPEAGIYEAFRVWNLWPIDSSMVKPLESAVEDWLDPDSHYAELQTFHWVDTGQMEFCDLAGHVGAGHEDEHEHVEETGYGGYLYEVCATGEAAFRDMESRLLVEVPNTDGAFFPRSFPGPDLPTALAPAWERLLASSEANTVRAASVFAPSEHSTLLKAERNYSPWLWLY